MFPKHGLAQKTIFFNRLIIFEPQEYDKFQFRFFNFPLNAPIPYSEGNLKSFSLFVTIPTYPCINNSYCLPYTFSTNPRQLF